MRIFFEKYFKNSINIKNKFISNKIVISTLEEISDLIFKTVKKEKILTCGNGGSFSDASHMTTELMVRYSKEFNRKPISCINLSNDGSLITAHTNDFNFETLFSRSLEGLGEKGDCLIIFSTSGNSNNIINVLKIAKKLGIHSIGFLGNDGGLAKEICDIPLIVNSNKTSHIQECHIVCIHAIVESLEINLSSQ